MLRSIIIALGAAFILFPMNPATAQQICGERANFTIKLEQKYAEHPIAMGLTDKGAVLEVFASKNGSWTFLVTMPNGLSCIVASGQSWESLTVTSLDQIS